MANSFFRFYIGCFAEQSAFSLIGFGAALISMLCSGSVMYAWNGIYGYLTLALGLAYGYRYWEFLVHIYRGEDKKSLMGYMYAFRYCFIVTCILAAANVMCQVLQWGMFPTFEVCGWSLLIGFEVYNYLYLLDRFPYSTAGSTSVY